MLYSVDDFVRDVRVAVDEDELCSGLLSDGDADALTFDALVRSKVCDAVRMVLSEAPARLLDGCRVFGGPVFWCEGGGGRGWVSLPDDFMRLVVFMMSDWERPVYDAIDARDPRYEAQWSRFGGVRGNPQKPVAAVSRRNEGLCLEFFSCADEDAEVSRGLYVPFPVVDDGGCVELPEGCLRASVYMAAGLVLLSLGRGDQSSQMFNLSKSLLR